MDVRRPETLPQRSRPARLQRRRPGWVGRRRHIAGRCVDGDALADVARLEGQQFYTYHARWTFVGP